jgi:D-alanyl-D-alanine carboxypeptidase/D-alanyl-D-alanine-endopeptidase (penicillin-binding protein 4)
VAIHVRDLDSGAVLFDQHGDRLMNPASNQKLVTATAAAELLGPDYRFETRVERRGDALVLVGEGDPGLQLAHLYELAAAVVRSGAAEGATRLLVDDAAFSARTYGPGYGPEGDGDAYTAPSSALSLHWNTVRVTVRPGPSGHAPEVTVEPPSAHVIVDNRAKTGGRADLRVRSEARGDQTAVVVEGTLPGGHRPMQWFRRVHDPAAFTGHAFARLVHEVGGPQLPVARLDAEPSLDRTSAARVVATHQSPPLSELLESALKFSNNFTTEQVLRTLAWRATGRPGSWVDGREVLRQWWSATGHGDAAIVLHNGSGLSRKGRVRARDLVDVVARSSAAGAELPELVAALPAAGRDGTLRRRMGAAHGRIRAKTGTMGGVSSLSGVVVSEGGQRRVGFSVIVNDAGDLGRARALQDRVALAILRRIDALDPAS